MTGLPLELDGRSLKRGTSVMSCHWSVLVCRGARSSRVGVGCLPYLFDLFAVIPVHEAAGDDGVELLELAKILPRRAVRVDVVRFEEVEEEVHRHLSVYPLDHLPPLSHLKVVAVSGTLTSAGDFPVGGLAITRHTVSISPACRHC